MIRSNFDFDEVFLSMIKVICYKERSMEDFIYIIFLKGYESRKLKRKCVSDY